MNHIDQVLTGYRNALCESCEANQTRHQIPKRQLEWSVKCYWRGLPPQNRPCPVGLTSFGLRKADRKSTRLNSSHGYISYAVFCLKKKKQQSHQHHFHECRSPRSLPAPP